jgi:hypothetical protein
LAMGLRAARIDVYGEAGVGIVPGRPKVRARLVKCAGIELTFDVKQGKITKMQAMDSMHKKGMTGENMLDIEIQKWYVESDRRDG